MKHGPIAERMKREKRALPMKNVRYNSADTWVSNGFTYILWLPWWMR